MGASHFKNYFTRSMSMIIKNEVPDDEDALAYMMRNNLSFVQYRSVWECKRKEGIWVLLIDPSSISWSDVVWGISVSGIINSINLTSNAGVNVFSWVNESSTQTEQTIVMDVSLSLLKLGMTSLTLQIDSIDKPKVSAIHVLYNDIKSRRYEAQRPVLQGYNVISDLWNPSTQTLQAVP